MLYLITGQPGSGKSNYMVSQLLNNPDLKNRLLFIDGIPELDASKIPHEAIPDGHSPEDWQDWLPDGSILVVDECQRYFRPRPSGAPPRPCITELETHRHRGVDFFFLTQHTRLIDNNVKSFVENHKHFGKTQLGTRRIFEWQRTGNPDSRADVRSALVHAHKLDKKVFDLYKSAEVHTKIKVNRSKWVWFFPLVLIVAIALIAASFQKVKSMGQIPDAYQTEQTKEEGVAPSQSGFDNALKPAANAQASASLSRPLSLEDYQPSIPQQPWTAPIYDNLNRNVQSMPYPKGCVKNSRKCVCYTEQSTIVSVSQVFCETHVKQGVFNPYQQPYRYESKKNGD